MDHYNQNYDTIKYLPLYNEYKQESNFFGEGCNFVAFATVNSRYNENGILYGFQLGIIPVPGSIYDRLNIQKELTPILEMPWAENI